MLFPDKDKTVNFFKFPISFGRNGILFDWRRRDMREERERHVSGKEERRLRARLTCVREGGRTERGRERWEGKKAN